MLIIHKTRKRRIRDSVVNGRVTWRGLALATVMCLVNGCGEEAPTEPPQPVATTVTVAPSSATLYALSDTIRFTATVLDQNGQVMTGVPVTYSSSAESVATVDGSGLVTAVGNGSATVTATSGTASGSAAVTVEQRVAEVRVSPDSVTLIAIGDTVRLVAEAVDSNGHAVVAAQLFDWSSDEAVATVDTTGLATAVGNGSATVTATSGTASGSAVVTVEQRVAEVRVSPDSVTLFAIGDTVRLVAEVLDPNGQPVVAAQLFDWSSDEAVATVDTAGLVTAVGNGNAVVTGTSGTASGRATVIVEQRVAEVRVSPDSVTLFAIGNTVRLEARALDSNGQAVVNAEFEWSSDEAVAPVDASGLVTAVGEGDAVVTATSGSSSGSAAVTVTVLAGPAKDRAILEALYEATGGPYWRNNDNWLTDAPLDDWYGVGTDLGGRVVEVKLIANNLEGQLPPELGRLDELRHLRFDGALAYGTTCYRPYGWPGSASEAGSHYSRSWVRHTVEGRTHGVDLVADTPARTPLTPGARLQSAGNRLVGRIPPELGDLANLETLSFNLNELSGSLPPELRKLVNLRTLSLVRNQLTGSLPPELGDLINLERLDLSISYDLSLKPPRPRFVLSGPLPPELGKLVNLKELVLKGHKFTGSLPPELGKLTKLQHLGLACNLLSGPVPPALRQLRDLRHLNLFGNQLHGIPVWLGELTRLNYVDFTANHYLTGHIPPSVFELAELGTLNLGSNRLSGPIPAELGRLAKLEYLALHYNQWTGALPSQLGNLTKLWSLKVFGNAGLAGPLPRELMQTPLRDLMWGRTNLCAPRDRAFQAWLASLLNNYAGRNCTMVPREVFAAFYEATGGSGWASNANWFTDAPVSSWFGVTVEDSLVTALELPGNGLSGTLPPGVGDFVDLKRLDLARNALTSGLPADLGDLTELEALDLSSNGFSGPVRPELARLGALQRLDLSDNALEGALPGVLTNLQSLSHFNWSESGACAPEAAWFQTWLGSVATRSGPTCNGLFSLSVASAHLSQAAQDHGGAVPLIAGRPALVRVLATADRANDHRPSTRVEFLLDGRKVHTAEMALGSSRGLAESLPGQLDEWYQAVIPVAALRPGVEMSVQVDPDSIMPRTTLDEVRLPLDVREMPPMELTIVPIVTGSSRDGDVLDWIRRADDPPLEFMRAVLPVGELGPTIREPLTIAAVPTAPRDWFAILQNIELLRTTEGGSGYWYGVVNREGDEGIAGIAQVEGRVSLGIPDPEVLAHEVGHNMSLMHAPCGYTTQRDPNFPYKDGNIGVYGYDARSGELVDPSTPDLMSYCHPQWISDYNFKKALEYRIQAEARPPALAARDRSQGSRLLLWGHVSAEGELRLDPAFSLDAPAKRPSGSGPYRVEGFARDGTSAFALDFDMDKVSEGGGSFLFLVLFGEDRLASLERIALSGPEGSTALERSTPTRPMAIVIDPATGRIRSILRGEAAEVAIAAGAADVPPGTVPREQLLVSYGVPEPVPR